MDKIIKYKYNEYRGRRMNVGVMVGSMIKIDTEFIKYDDFHSVVCNGSEIENDGIYSVSVICYERVGRKPYHLCWMNNMVYVLYGPIEDSKMKVLLYLKVTEKGYEKFEANNKVDISGILEYDEHCDEVDRKLSDVIYEELIKKMPFGKIRCKNGFTYFFGNLPVNKKSPALIISGSPSNAMYGMSFNTSIIPYDGTYDPDFVKMETSDYSIMLNLMFMALNDGKGTRLADLIEYKEPVKKASFSIVDGLIAASIAYSFDSNLDECITGIYTNLREYVFITEEMRELFVKYGVWCTPDVIAKTAISLYKVKG